ncbi:LacI family DNA-binding transcriptional regulator [Vagococcus sp.]|uniref:LacI family DNA-binding transcriptional regulator n=1 Tax=Vagococcus sp. TaxID=1933889 RepID=UPI003F995119
MKATMKDVARLAGVGVGTVSRVINGVTVKPKTKEKVDAAIQELNYTPNEYARGLKTKTTQTVALILPTIWHPFFAEFAYYVEEFLSNKNYKLFLCNSDGKVSKEKEYIQMVKQNKVDGIIGITYSDVDQYISANLPFVSVDRHFSEDVCYVTADNLVGGQLAAKELVERGSKYVAFIGSYSEYPNETTKRLDGFIDYCLAHEIAYEILSVPEPYEEFNEHLEKFLIQYPELDGLFVVNDFVALGVIDFLEEKKLKKVGVNCQVIGFDGIRLGKGHKKMLSTIVQPIKEMAEFSVAHILSIIAGEEVPKRTFLPVCFEEGVTTFKKLQNND